MVVNNMSTRKVIKEKSDSTNKQTLIVFLHAFFLVGVIPEDK